MLKSLNRNLLRSRPACSLLNLNALNNTNRKLFAKEIHLSSQMNIKNKAVEKEKLSKPRSQLKGVELLRNPGLFKVF